MPAPDFWVRAGVRSEELGLEKMVTGVFLHEFAHTRQISGFQDIIGPIERTWTFPEELSDDVVQERFERDPAYVAAYAAERDVLFQAAAADSLAGACALAAKALAMMRARHDRWFTGEHEVFRTLDDVFLAFEGVAQWTGYAWLIHPEGGEFRPDVTRKGFRRGGRQWSQDEGFALLLVVDRLLPDWPTLAFDQPRPAGGIELLERATERADRCADEQ